MMRDKDGMPYKLVKVPVYEPVAWHNVYEHTPLDWHKYGEYPRFIRPVGAHQPRYEICKERIKQTAFDETQEGGGFWEFADAIEAKLKEKNT